MQFDSVVYLVFIGFLFALYRAPFSNRATIQNLILLAGSVVFYIYADWRYLLLLLGNGFVTYYAGYLIAARKNERSGRVILIATIVVVLGLLIFFKYFNFVAEGIYDLINLFRKSDYRYSPLGILLPLGISFFTFQTLGYVIDIYYDRITPGKSFFNYIVYVTYFPKLIAGPIERVQNFLPQIVKARTFDYYLATDGMRQILWGYFKKIVIADNCTVIVNRYFDNMGDFEGSTLLIGLFFYMFQIYCDFSGYTDIALGTSKLFGIRLMRNFNYPYFCTDISDFWRRWHISLSTWMMDYVYSPLSFSLRKAGKAGLMISIVITFVIVGLWHGPDLTFVVFGLLHGLYFIPLVFYGNLRNPLSSLTADQGSRLVLIARMLFMFVLLMFTSAFFRASDLPQAIEYLASIFNASLFSMPEITGKDFMIGGLIFALMITEWHGKNSEYALAWLAEKSPLLIRWPLYYGLIFLIFLLRGQAQQFIYFQF